MARGKWAIRKLIWGDYTYSTGEMRPPWTRDIDRIRWFRSKDAAIKFYPTGDAVRESAVLADLVGRALR